MQNWWKKVICAGLVGVSVLTANYAEAGVPNKFPLQCYASKQVTTYNSINGSRWGYISANADLIQITQINGDWAYGSYPTSKGRISRWFRLSDIVPNLSFSSYETGMYRASKAYRTESSGTVLGTVYVNDKVTVVYRGSSRSQVIYPVSGGYKMGWVNNNDIRQTNSNNSLTDVSGYREFSAIEKNAYLNKKTSKKAEIYNDPDLRTRAGLYWGPGATLGVVGMTSKAFKVEYSYGGTGRVGWVTKDIYDMVDQVSRPSKPSNFSINTNKTSYNVGETIQFNFSSTGADELYIPIDINGKREHFINVTGKTSYSMQATTPGTYSYTLYGRNKNGEYNIAYKSFSVSGNFSPISNRVGNALSRLEGQLGRQVGSTIQCVSVIREYSGYLGLNNPISSGNACDYATRPLSASWIRVKNGVPRPGDILVYVGAKFGHIAVYGYDGYIYEQNMSDKNVGNNLRKIKVRYDRCWYSYSEGGTKYYWGYIRPNV